MRSEKLEEVGVDFVIFKTMAKAGPVPYGSSLMNAEGGTVARVTAVPQMVSSVDGISRYRYPVEFRATLAKGDTIHFR